jgi:CII-binding regulator of phage lambda lysogenization HflD
MTAKVASTRLAGLSEYFLNLTSARAFVLFLLALALGMFFIATDWGLPWAPGLPVLAYGVLLLYCQMELFVRLDESTKDSAYFLGFLLTLAALMKVLFQLAAVEQGNVRALVSGGAGSILPTLAGLLMRQALWSRDPGEDEQEVVFKSLREQLREHATNFDHAQKRLIALIEEFVDSREKLFGREEQAFTRYLKTLDDNWMRLNQIAALEATRLESASKALDDGAARVSSASETLAAKLSSTGQQLESLKTLMQRLAQVMDERAKAIAGVGSSLNPLVSVLTAATTDLQALRQATQAAAADVKSLATVLTAMPAGLKSAFDGAAGDVVRLHGELTAKMRLLADDVNGIDQVLDQLTALLKNRIASLEVSR